MESSALSGFHADIAKLDAGIRQLKIQYDMFFAGALPREPQELRAELEKIIRRHTYNPGLKYAERFHFNALVSRYNCMSELWNKTVRSLEGSDRKAPALCDKFDIKERLVARCRLSDVGSSQDNLRRLHSRYVAARKRCGTGGAPTFESFVRGIDTQIQRLREQTRCDQIELRLVVRDDTVQLKARPGR